MGMSGDTALALAKSYVKKTLQGQGALKGQDGFSPTVKENPSNTDNDYRLDITDKNGTFTTPNLKGADGSGSDYKQLKNKPSINGVEIDGNKTLDDLGIQPKGEYLTEETDPTVPQWAKENTKPTYTASEVGADSTGSADMALSDAKEYTDNKIADLVGGAPETLDTLKEIADALKTEQSTVDALQEAIGTKLNKDGDSKDNTVTFVQSETRENIDSGEKHSVLFGKIRKWLFDLKEVAFSGSYTDLNNKPSAEDIGALPKDGNATSATKATNDGDGNNIAETYATKEEFNNLEIGGRNLQIGSKNWDDNAFFRKYDVVISDGEMNVPNLKGADTRFIDVKYGEVYSVGVDIKCDAEITGKTFVILYFDSSSTLIDFEWVNRTVTTEYKRITHTFTISNNSVAKISIGLRANITAPYSYTYRLLKIENGNKPTPWTPAPEDIEKAIQTVDNKLTNNLLKPTLETTEKNGVTCTNNGDGTYTLNGTGNADSYFTLYKGNLPQGKLKLVGCPNEGTQGKYLIRLGKGETDSYIGFDTGHGLAFDSDGGIYVIKIHFYNEQTYDNLVFKPMLTTNLNADYSMFVSYTGSTGQINSDVAEVRKDVEGVNNDLGGLSFSVSDGTLSITDGTNTWTLPQTT